MEIAELWQKYKTGTATLEELTELDKVLQTENGQLLLEQLLEVDWQQTPLNAEVNFSPEATFQQIKSNIKPTAARPNLTVASRQPLRFVGAVRRIAAVLLFLIIAGTVIWWQWEENRPNIVQVNRSTEIQMIALEDGSQVWLNRNSRLIYPKHFTDSIREVALEGEAFFEVAKNAQKPFLVNAGSVQTRVLGTAFNVRAYPQQQIVEVALVEGKVRVNVVTDTISSLLAPGDRFAYNQIKKNYTNNQFDQDEPYAWRKGMLHFQKAPVREVAEKLEARYGIRFTIEQEEKIQGTLVLRYDTRKVTLDEVLQNISSVMDYTFVRKTKKEILIRPK